MQFISFHTAINYQSVQFVERILLSQIGHEDPCVTILLCTSGGDSGAATGLHHLMRALPYPVHIHAAGMCASGGVSLLAGAQRRTCSPGTYFMLHGSVAPDGSLSPQVGMTRDIFKHVLAWDQTKLDHYFSDVSEKWFDDSHALSEGLIEKIEPFVFPSSAKVHMVPN